MPRVLIVEDDEDVLQMMQLLLGSSGYETSCARNGLEALAEMRDHRPCMVLLDLQMPVMDGFQFRERQLADPELAAVPVVCITAHYDPARVSDQMGVPCLTKPPDFPHVVDVVDANCRRQRTRSSSAAPAAAAG